MNTTETASTAAERKRMQRARDREIRLALIAGKMPWQDAPERVLISFFDRYSYTELPDQARAAWREIGRRNGWA